MNSRYGVYLSPWPKRSVPPRNRATCVRCEDCGRMVAATNMERHRESCQIQKKLPDGHRICGVDGCTRMKPAWAPTCWEHEQKDAVFARLDAAIAGGCK